MREDEMGDLVAGNQTVNNHHHTPIPQGESLASSMLKLALGGALLASGSAVPIAAWSYFNQPKPDVVKPDKPDSRTYTDNTIEIGIE